MSIFLFDVDGTITETRAFLLPPMHRALCRLIELEHLVYLVTGSNIEKTNEQCGNMVKQAHGVFACSGNAFYVGGQRIFQNNWVPPNPVVNWLMSELGKSEYKVRTGNHIELRPGSLNFSVVGRNANHIERQDYRLFDLATFERTRIAERFNRKFGALTAKIGGETGIDIAPKGNDKGQVFRYLAPLIWQRREPVYFFGDRMEPGGNDEPLMTVLASSCADAYSYAVKGPDHTLSLLRGLTNHL